MGEAVIIDVVRTPLGKYGGTLSGVHPVDLLGLTMKELFRRTGVDITLIDDHLCGCATQVGEQGYNMGRNAGLAAGLPESISGCTVDRQCASSMQSVQFAAHGIDAGMYDLVVASGVESMSRVPIDADVEGADPFGQLVRERTDGKMTNVGICAELISHKYGISREAQDDFAYRSHVRAAEAYRSGRHRSHVFPVDVTLEDGSPSTLSRDEAVRLEPDRAKMGELSPAFYDQHWEGVFPGQIDWTVTAGNSSAIADGAVAVLLASRRKASELGLRPRARIVAESAVGADPVLQLTGPLPATRQALQRAGLSMRDIGAVEINEAFACVVLTWKKELDLSDEWFEEKVNPNGGAIAVGHPLGASGGRLLADLLGELDHREAQYGLQVMCALHGMSNAFVIERIA